MTKAESGAICAGIGGLDWAVERAFGVRTAWQLDLVGAAVRGRHFPDALQIEADISTVDPTTLPPVKILCGGFSCKGLSHAGKMQGLGHPETRVTYFGLLVFAGADPRYLKWEPSDDRFGANLVVCRRPGWAPDAVVIENTPAMLAKMQVAMEAHFWALGFSMTWVRARAFDAGHPHRRARVFALAERGGQGRGVLDAPRDNEWTPARGERAWPTPMSASTAPNGHSGSNRALPDAVRLWPTVVSRDYKTGDLPDRVGTEALSAAAGAPSMDLWGRRMNPAWTEALMGYPPGWTETEGPQLHIDPDAPAVRGRYPESWDRMVYWPGFDWEPLRTLPDGPPSPGRPARIRGVGNAVDPHQGLIAIKTALRPVVWQSTLF